jgi:hypothetical protein
MTRIVRILCVALLALAGLVGASLPARADEKCEKRVHQAEDKLRDAIQRHGEDSKEARKRRAELEDAKRHCPDYHEHHDMDHHDDPH